MKQYLFKMLRSIQKAYVFTLLLSFLVIILAFLTAIGQDIPNIGTNPYILNNMLYLGLANETVFVLLIFLCVFPVATVIYFLNNLFFKYAVVEQYLLNTHWIQKLHPLTNPFLSSIHFGFIVGLLYALFYNIVFLLDPSLSSPFSLIYYTIFIRGFAFFLSILFSSCESLGTLVWTAPAIAFSLPFNIVFILRLLWLLIVKRKPNLLSSKPV